MQLKSCTHPLGGSFDGCEEGFYKAAGLGLTQLHCVVSPDDLFRCGTHMRNHENRDGAALQTSGTFQQGLVVRGNSGNEAIRAAGCGDGGHGVCVPKCATLRASRKSGF